MGGAIALDYVPLFMRMEKIGLSKEEWDDKFRDIRVIEAAALGAMNSKQ